MEREQVVESAVLVDLGVDSLMLAELMFEAEDSLGISIDSNVEVPKRWVTWCNCSTVCWQKKPLQHEWPSRCGDGPGARESL
ncbi:MAG: acyl carrier protein [Burkholderiaceae bacterium]